MRTNKVITTALAVAVCSGALAAGSADAATQAQSCTDGAKRVWKAKAIWGEPYVAADGTTKVSIDYAGWTTNAQSLTTQSKVKTYHPNGTLMQTLTREQAFDYNAGATWIHRNPINPPSKPGSTKVTVEVGLRGTANCTVTFVQPPTPVAETRVSSSAITSTSVTVNWTAVPGATGYLVGRDGPNDAGVMSWSTTDPATATSRVFSKLVPGTTYQLFVQPIGGVRKTVTVTTAPAATPTPAPSPTPSPTAGANTETAVIKGWGTPTAGDEFNYTGAPTSTKWSVYNSAGHAGNGTRRPANVTVNGTVLDMVGKPDGSTGGMSSKFDRTGSSGEVNGAESSGRWETRMRVFGATPAAYRASGYHPVLIVWPDGQRTCDTNYQEIDYSESTGDVTKVKTFVHHAAGPGCTNRGTAETWRTIDQRQWHNYAVEWTQTKLTTYVDGQVLYTTTNPAIIPDHPSHSTIQLDNFLGNLGESHLQVDWTRYYAMP